MTNQSAANQVGPLADANDADVRELRHCAAGARVLVVEDDAEQSGLISLRLRADGFMVFEVGAGDLVVNEMIAMTNDCWPYEGVDLLLMDIWLPGIAGLEVLGMLREGGWTLPVLLMTGNANAALVADAKRFGVPLLEKPFSLATLSRSVLATLLHRPLAEVIRFALPT